MSGRLCPYCKEKIKKDALVCKYCHREVNPIPDDDHSTSITLFSGIIGVAAGAALALLWGYYKERKKWKEDDLNFVTPDEARFDHTSSGDAGV